jgi:hypothetical protein
VLRLAHSVCALALQAAARILAIWLIVPMRADQKAFSDMLTEMEGVKNK